MLSDHDVLTLREELANAKNPLFFYDGDGDGLTAFLLLYHLHREGKGIALTNSKNLDDAGLRKVQEIQPDKIFILDIPVVSQDFLNMMKCPVFWIDHHTPVQRQGVHYFNPRLKEAQAYVPTSRMAWQVSQQEEDLWIATAGSLADFYIPDFLPQFIARYPSYLEKAEDLPTMLFQRRVGHLVKLFFFLQKGPSGDVRKSIKILTKIKSPDEIFQQTTSAGKLLFKRFQHMNELYGHLLEEAKKNISRSKLVLFNYAEDRWSFTSNLANELSGQYPQKYILIARRKGGQVKCSLRGKSINKMLENALTGIQGTGGGHEDACGAVIPEAAWEQFLQQLKEAIKDAPLSH